MKKIPNRFKLTPEVYKRLLGIADEIGPFQRRDKKGNLMFREITKVVKGKDIPDGTKLSNSDKKVDPETNYSQTIKEPIMVVHKINLCEIYQKDGQPGIDAYVNHFKEIEKESREKSDKISEVE